MSIYVTGDCHSDFTRFHPEYFPEQNEMNRDDVVIILGDFGGIWARKDDEYYIYQSQVLDELESRNFTTVFIDGNHENFDLLNQYPIKMWNGGKVHEIRPHIFHLMRGEIFEIQGKTFYAFGGATSHDICDGIIEYDKQGEWKKQVKALRNAGKCMFRINHFSWWKEEMPTKEEMEYGYQNLMRHDRKVNYILTHSPSTSESILLGYDEINDLTDYLDRIMNECEFDLHLFGHMHENRMVNHKSILMYEMIEKLV